MTTPVIFKMEGRGKDASPVAFFPTIPADNSGSMVTCYAHLGQHAGASLSYVMKCRPAKPERYADLQAELVSMGYDDLKPIRRMTQAHHSERRRALSR